MVRLRFVKVKWSYEVGRGGVMVDKVPHIVNGLHITVYSAWIDVVACFESTPKAERTLIHIGCGD